MKPKKKFLLVANWKCNPAALPEARRLFLGIEKISPASGSVTVVVAPPFPYLLEAKTALRRAKRGAQNVFWESTGAYTGEVGPRMLVSTGVQFCIIGHSERREHFGETNEIIQKKMRAALKAGLRPVLCVGERTREGEAADYIAYVKEEVRTALQGVSKKDIKNVTVAYEPIWAVGSDEADTPDKTLEMVLYIRKMIADLYDHKIAQDFPVLYGGSANAANARLFLEEGGVDGLLVGRASLKVTEFGKIIAAAVKISN